MHDSAPRYLYLGKLVCDVAFCVGFNVKMNQIPPFLAQIFTALLSAPGLGHASVTRRDALPPAYRP